MVGAAIVAFLKLYAQQKGASHFSSGGGVSILLALTPFLFAVLVLNLHDGARALKYLSLAIIFQSVITVLGYYKAIFLDTGLEGSIDLGMIPLFQFAFLGVAAAATKFIKEPNVRGMHRK